MFRFSGVNKGDDRHGNCTATPRHEGNASWGELGSISHPTTCFVDSQTRWNPSNRLIMLAFVLKSFARNHLFGLHGDHIFMQMLAAYHISTTLTFTTLALVLHVRPEGYTSQTNPW